MKNVFQCFLVAVCLFVASNVQVMAEAVKEDGKIDIPLIIGKPFDGSEFRDGGITPFTAYYQGGVVYISTSAEFSVISLNVGNEVSGQEWSSATDISDGMGEISIANGASGSYTVEIVTEYGERFTGSFRL